MIYYNVYIAPASMGPWTKVNVSPIQDVGSAGNEYTISGLTNGVPYYIMVVGGTMSGDTFVPICGQPLVNGQESGLSVSNPNLILSRPKDLT